jgi:hypothetical protein
MDVINQQKLFADFFRCSYEQVPACAANQNFHYETGSLIKKPLFAWLPSMTQRVADFPLVCR